MPMGSIDSREVGGGPDRVHPLPLPQSPQDCRGGSLPWVVWYWYLWAVSFMHGGDRGRPMATSFNSAGLTATQRSAGNARG